jgi:hypothetical protein
MNPQVEIRLTEFSDLIDGYTKDFVGREWLVEQVDELFDDPACHFVVLTGGAGVGKSAFMAHLAATHPQWPRYFIRRDSRVLLRPGDAKTFLLTVGGQLATLYPDLFKPENLEVVVRQRIGDLEASGEAIAVRIKELRASPFYRVAIQAEQEIQRVAGKATGVEIGHLVSEPRQMSMQDLQYLGLLDPAWLLHQTDPDARIVVLVDALDELRYSPAEEDILRALVELPVEPSNLRASNPTLSAKKLDGIPPNLRFVISSRKEQFLDRLLDRRDAHELPLDVAGGKNLKDLRTYAKANLPGEELEPHLKNMNTTKQELLENLLGKAAGNFLYLRSVLGAIWEALSVPAKHDRLQGLLRVEALPDDLDSLYDYFLASIVNWIKRSGFGDAAWRQALRPLLGTLAVAREPLNEEQLVAYTGLNSEDVADLLRELRQFVEPVDDRRAYRIYHASFAEYVLDAESNLDYRIDGHRAHKRIAEYYVDAWGGLEASLPGLQEPQVRNLHGGYGVQHLAAHLEGADQIDVLHEILRLERPEEDRHENVWYAAREKSGDTASYMADLEVAWRCSESTDVWSLGRQIRLALLESSVRSPAGSIPPGVIPLLVKHQRLTLPRALADIALMPKDSQRVRALKELAPLLTSAPEPVQRQALAVAQAIPEELERGWAFGELGTCLPTPLQAELLDHARAIVYEPARAQALSGLVPHLPEELRLQALAAARQIADSAARAQALTPLARHLTNAIQQQAVSEALEAARGITQPGDRAKALADLLPDLPKTLRAGVFQEVLAATQEMTTLGTKPGILSQLVAGVPDDLKPAHLKTQAMRQALTAIEAEGNSTAGAEALVDLFPHLPKGLKPEALRIAQTIDRGSWPRAVALSGLAAHFPPPQRAALLNEALDTARAEADPSSRVEALCTVVGHLDEAARVEVMQEAIAAIASIQDESWRSSAVRTAAGYLSAEQAEEALAMAQAMADLEERAEAVVALIPSLPVARRGGLLDGIKTTGQRIGDEGSRALACSSLLAHLPGPQQAAAVKEILTLASMPQAGRFQEFAMARALVVVVDHLPPDRRAEVLAVACRLTDEEARAVVLHGLARRLPAPVLAAARGIKDDYRRAQLLITLAPHLSDEGLDQAVAMATGLEAEVNRVQALVALAPRLPDWRKQELFQTFQSLQLAWQRAEALAWLAGQVSGELRAQVLDVALVTVRTIKEPWIRASAYGELLPQLPKSRRAKVASEALIVAEQIDEAWLRARELAGLAEHLSGPLKQQMMARALRAARAEPSPSKRAEALLMVANSASERAKSIPIGEALDAVRVMHKEDETGFAQILIPLAQEVDHLPVATQHDVLQMTQSIGDASTRVGTLAALAPRLSPELRDLALQEALDTARTLHYALARAPLLSDLVSPLSGALRAEVEREAFSTALEAQAYVGDERTYYLAQLVSFWTDAGFPEWVCDRTVWQETLRLLRRHRRPELAPELAVLAPALERPGDAAALDETFLAIQDVGRWWP